MKYIIKNASHCLICGKNPYIKNRDVYTVGCIHSSIYYETEEEWFDILIRKFKNLFNN